MKINGKEVKVLLDFGALEILYEEEGIDYIAQSRRMFMELESGKSEEEVSKQFNNLKMTKGMLYAAVKRYSEENGEDMPVTKDDIKKMTIAEYTAAEMEMSMLVAGFNIEPEKAKKKKTSKNAKSLNSA